MIRWSILACLLSFLAAFQPAWAGPSMLRMGVDNWPPYEFFDDDRLQGISVDLTRLVLAEMQAEHEVHPLPWKRALDMLARGEIDMLVSGVKSPKRAAAYLYPEEPLVYSSWRLFVPAHSAIDNVKALRGKRVGLVLGYHYPDNVGAWLWKETAVQEVNTDETNLRKLANGRLDAVVADALNALWTLRKVKLESTVKPVGPSLGQRPVYVLFSRETVSSAFVEAFSRTLGRIKQTPQYQTILEHYRP